MRWADNSKKQDRPAVLGTTGRSRYFGSLPVHRRAELEQPTAQDRSRLQVGRVDGRLVGLRWPRVEHVVHLEHAVEPRRADAEAPRQPQVGLIESLVERLTRWDDTYLKLLRARARWRGAG